MTAEDVKVLRRLRAFEGFFDAVRGDEEQRGGFSFNRRSVREGQACERPRSLLDLLIITAARGRPVGRAESGQVLGGVCAPPAADHPRRFAGVPQAA